MGSFLSPVLLCLLLPAAQEGRVYYGVLEGARRPAEVDARKVFGEIPEYREIIRRRLAVDEPEYWVLLTRANGKFLQAVKRAAELRQCDVVVEKGTVKFPSAVPDLTEAVLAGPAGKPAAETALAEADRCAVEGSLLFRDLADALARAGQGDRRSLAARRDASERFLSRARDGYAALLGRVQAPLEGRLRKIEKLLGLLQNYRDRIESPR